MATPFEKGIAPAAMKVCNWPDTRVLRDEHRQFMLYRIHVMILLRIAAIIPK